MPGWRMGFAAGNEKLIGALARIKSYLDYGAFTPIQVAAAAALNGPVEMIDEIRAVYKSRRDVLVKSMGHSCTLNQGVSLGSVRGTGRPTIGNNCYFGAGCRVMGGVTIGDNVVVSANSLVVSDVPGGCTVMGVPARIISREVVSPYLKTPIAPTATSAASSEKLTPATSVK